MKFFTKKSNFKKVIISILIVLLCNFSAPTISYGTDLIDPITGFLIILPDGIFDLLQTMFIGGDVGELEISVTTPDTDALKELNYDYGTDIDGGTVGTGAGIGAIAGTVVPGIGTVVGAGIGALGGLITAWFSGDAKFNIINIKYTPYEIFSGDIPMLKADFFHTDAKLDGEGTFVTNSAKVLTPVVSKWYGILRSVAIVGLLTVLVYLAIRILLSSAAQDKAKYKQILKDWAVGMCLVFILHYIMSFTMLTVNYITDVFKNPDAVENLAMVLPAELNYNEGENDTGSKKAFEEHVKKVEKDGKEYNLLKMNVIEYIRFNVEVMEDENIKELGFTIMYIVLCIITCVFTFQYLKRVIYLAVLTILAPIVALTYPIDKIADGQAQGFNMWLKEYIFNALLQVMHLILYTIIITSAMELIKNNVVYAIVALGCLTMTEKLLRKIFGFEKASTVGAFGGAAGAAMVMSSLKKFRGPKPKKGLQGKDAKQPKLYQNKESFDAESVLRNSNSMHTLDRRAPSTESANGSGANTNSATESATNMAGVGAASASATNGNTGASGVGSAAGGNNNSTQAAQTADTTKSKVKGPRRKALAYAGRRFLRRNFNGKNARRLVNKAGRTVTKAIGATVGASIGLAAGVASGDMSKAFQYTAAGAMATGKVAGKIGHNVAQGASNGYKDYKAGRASIDTEYAGKLRYKDFKKNEQNREYIASRYADSYDRSAVYAMAEKASEFGNYSAEEVSAMYELQKQGLSQEHAIAIAQMSKKIGDISKPKDRKEQLDDLVKNGFDKDKAEMILNQIGSYNDLKD